MGRCNELLDGLIIFLEAFLQLISKKGAFGSLNGTTTRAKVLLS